MSGEPRAGNMLGQGATWRLGVASVVAAFALVLMGWVGEAHACPPGTKSHHATIKHHAKTAVVSARMQLTSGNSFGKKSVAIGHCCGGTSSSADSGCKTSCCSSGVAVAEPAADGLDYFDVPTGYLRLVQGSMTSTAPPAHFRPPQLAI
jgi:hypothetical protein